VLEMEREVSNRPMRQQWSKVQPWRTCDEDQNKNASLCIFSLWRTIKQTETNARKRKMNLQVTRDGLWRPRMEMEKRTRCFARRRDKN